MTKKTATYLLLLSLTPILVLGPGCAYRSQVNSSPDGAKVYFNGQNIGTTPGVVIPSQHGLPKQFSLRLTKEGYKERVLIIDRAYRGDANLLWLIFGFIPYFFSAHLDPYYNVTLEPEERIEIIREEKIRTIKKEETIVE